jgi:hypothetical protein
MNGSCRGLIKVISRNLLGFVEKNTKNHSERSGYLIAIFNPRPTNRLVNQWAEMIIE